MCGISGKISLTHTSLNASDIRRMNRAIAHRGPDDTGVYLSRDKKVGLGHQRLAIIDLSSLGSQPMRYLDRYTIVFNGEIYNFQEKRSQLEKEGYTFASHSDTEVILALYDKYKTDCLQHLRGMFAFAIYDEQEKTLFCARDRVGKKPFKYYRDGNVFIFASELKAILTQPEYHPAPDYTAIHHYLTLQYVPAPQTGFTGINKLEPAHYLWLDLKTKQLTKNRYWQLDYSPRFDLSEKEWAKRIREKLAESVELRMIADVPLGAFLSGGIDSSAIVALMAQNSAAPIKTFSIGFEDEKYNELKFAKIIADRFKTDHTEFIVKPEALQLLPMLVRHYEEPYADSSAIPTYYLSKLTRQHVTVALNGDGGDENFAGYSRYNWQRIAAVLDRLPRSVWPSLAALATALEKVSPTTLTHRASRFLKTMPEPAAYRYVNYICYFTNQQKKNLYQASFFNQMMTHDSYRLIEAIFADGNQSYPSILNQTLSADVRTYLPDDLLVKVDMATMVVGLEGRSPLLDHEFMALAATIPPALKLRGWSNNKYIFKKALAHMLPAEILHRPKRGFVVPIESWFRGDLHGYVSDILLGPQSTICRQLFRADAIRQLLHAHRTTSINYAPRIWALLTLELWYREYFT